MTANEAVPEAAVRIVSDGTSRGTGVWVNGELLEDVENVVWVKPANDYTTAVITLRRVAVDVTRPAVDIAAPPTPKPHLYIPWDGPGCAICDQQPDEHPKTLGGCVVHGDDYRDPELWRKANPALGETARS